MIAGRTSIAPEARVRGIIEAALDAIVTTDAQSTILEWNHHAEVIFGWSAEEAIGRNLNQTIIPPQHREAHNRGVRHYLATGEGPILNQRIEITAIRQDGSEFPVELTVAPIHWGAKVIFTSFIRDISERKRAEQQLAARYMVTRVLARSGTTQEAVPQILQAICESLGWDMGVFWSPGERQDVLEPCDVWTAGSREPGEFERASRQLAFAFGEGLPGRVWETRLPAWIPDLSAEPSFPRHAVAAEVGIRAAFAFPILVEEDFIGAMEFFQREVAAPDEGLLAVMAAMGNDIGQFMKRKLAEERLREREEVQRLLARMSTQLAASTPNYRDTLRTLAHLAVPALGDWCTIYTFDNTGQVERVEIAHGDPAKDDLARELVRYPIDPQGAHPAVRVLRTGESVLITEMTDPLVEAVARDAEHLRVLRELGLRSVIVVPLTARGRTLGALTLVASESGRRYGEEDQAVAQEFARRAALSVDNARLFADAEAANRAKAEFLATMSHELRTPLNAILGYTDLMRAGIPEPLAAASLNYVERVSLSARHLLQLIEEILGFSRLEAGRETVILQPVELEELVAEVRAMIEPLAAEKGLAFVVHAPAESVQLLTDPRKVRQILVNLLGNAIKFTDQGDVEFAVAAENRDIVFRVKDTGIGIGPEDLARVFEPFWQVQQSTTRVAEGTGLGLTVTRKIVELLGGSINVQSKQGEGTVFVVCLPTGLDG